MKERIEQNLAAIRARIEAACSRAGRSPDEVELLPVTKMVGMDEIRALYDLGVRAIGENRVKDAAEKKDALGLDGLAWRMIGHLQRNKVKKALAVFDAIESVDSVRLANEIEKEAATLGRKAPVLLEVNNGLEAQKAGFAEDELPGAAKEIAAMAHLEVRGLMVMAPFFDEAEEARPCFRMTRALFDELGASGIFGAAFRALSMGMTNDFEVAVEEGATVVRIGTAVFEGL